MSAIIKLPDSNSENKEATDEDRSSSERKIWQIMGDPFELESPRFRVVDYLGSGAYGVVCAVYDNFHGNVVAIKKCKKIFQSRTLAKRTLREIRLLRHFNHPNIIRIESILKPKNLFDFNDIYIVFEVMETDLAQIIRSSQKLKDQHVQYFTYQILSALEYLHSGCVVHRDIKPRNILVNSNCCLKVADFGLARIYKNGCDEKIAAITDYVTTRWYRAPEIIVGFPSYTTAVDLWAVGCIIAELIYRSPIFPGSDTMKQLELICKYLGKPNDNFIHLSKKQPFKSFLSSFPSQPINSLDSLLANANPSAVALIKNLLEYSPEKRFSAAQCLQHPYITSVNQSIMNCINENGSDMAVVLEFKPEEFRFEQKKLTLEDLKNEIHYEVSYHISRASRDNENAILPQNSLLKYALVDMQDNNEREEKEEVALETVKEGIAHSVAKGKQESTLRSSSDSDSLDASRAVKGKVGYDSEISDKVDGNWVMKTSEKAKLTVSRLPVSNSETSLSKFDKTSSYVTPNPSHQHSGYNQKVVSRMGFSSSNSSSGSPQQYQNGNRSSNKEPSKLMSGCLYPFVDELDHNNITDQEKSYGSEMKDDSDHNSNHYKEKNDKNRANIKRNNSVCVIA